MINENSTFLDVVWEAGKAHAEGEYVPSIKAVQSDFCLTDHSIGTEQGEAMAFFAVAPTPENYSGLAQVRRELKLHYISLVQSDAQRLVAK